MDISDRFPCRITRWQALGIHLLISAAIAAGVLILMLAVWYPPPFFEVLGGKGLVFILVGVNVVLGPLVTWVIFKPGKPGLKFDIGVVTMLQLAALAYGCTVVAAVRPVFVVLVKDQFEVVSAADLGPEQLARARRPEYRRLPLSGPALVYSEAPTEGEARREVLLTALSGGPDVHQRPEYYVPYAERRREALGFSHTLEHARDHWPPAVPPIERYLADSGRKPEAVRYLAGRAPRGWFVCIIDAVSGGVLTMNAVNDFRE